jgi:ribonuclease-3
MNKETTETPLEYIGDIRPYILNDTNKLINKDIIENILKKYGFKYKLKNLKLFQEALTHVSYTNIYFNEAGDIDNNLIKECKTLINSIDKGMKPINIEILKDVVELQKSCYEQLEFLGDSIIHFALTDYLCERFKGCDEGFLTRLRSKIENGQTLSDISKAMGLHEYVLLAKYMEFSKDRSQNYHVLEDIFEAFIGALYYDSNKDKELCVSLIIKLVETNIDITELLSVETNYKDTLLQYYHKKKWVDPKYDLVETLTKNNNKYFKMCVRGPDGRPIGYGEGASKKAGEQEAAKQALIYFGEINENSDDEEDEIIMLESDEEIVMIE